MEFLNYEFVACCLIYATKTMQISQLNLHCFILYMYIPYIFTKKRGATLNKSPLHFDCSNLGLFYAILRKYKKGL